jgi:hypothetical protein
MTAMAEPAGRPSSHLCRVVITYRPENFDAAVAAFTAALGIDFGAVLEPPGMGLRLAISFDAGIELVAPIGEEGYAPVFWKALAERGEGIQQLVFRVPDLEAQVAASRAAGWEAGDLRLNCFDACPHLAAQYAAMTEAGLPPVAGVAVVLLQADARGPQHAA